MEQTIIRAGAGHQGEVAPQCAYVAYDTKHGVTADGTVGVELHRSYAATVGVQNPNGVANRVALEKTGA
jgi:hypothetical protein